MIKRMLIGLIIGFAVPFAVVLAVGEGFDLAFLSGAVVGMGVALAVLPPEMRDQPPDTSTMAYRHAAHYGTDLATGRTIAELEKMNEELEKLRMQNEELEKERRNNGR